MILLDTNVISAVMRQEPDPAVVRWLDDQPAESVWTTSVTIFEVRVGLELLAAGRRRRQLEAAFEEMLSEDIQDRVQPFDHVAAAAAASIAAAQRQAGRPVEIRDVQIAGIARARRAALATRNVRHFADAGIHLVDPWAA